MLLYIKTIQAHIISLINEALKNIIYEVNFNFSKEGLTIKAANNSGSQIVHLFLDGDKFEKFECNRELICVGVDVINFSKIMKTATKQEILSFSMSENDTSTLNISMTNTVTNMTKNYEMKLIDIDFQQKIEIPVYSKEESSVIHIQSPKFKSICKSLGLMSEQIEITCIRSYLKFECVDLVRTLQIKADHVIDLTSDTNFCFVSNRTDSIFRGIFNLVTLSQFTRFSNLCTHVELTLQNDLPLCITYACGPLGYIKLFLLPINT